MSGWEQLAVLMGGLAAGTVNALAGSGSLITFPLLLALGFPPVTANVSNTVGLIPGSLSGAVGYRRELAGQRGRVIRLGSASALGGLTGGVILLALPAKIFAGIVPYLIGVACLLVIVQPAVSRSLERRGTADKTSHPDAGPALLAGSYVCGIYGGYFGAGLGVLLLGLFGIGLNEGIQRINAVKNAVVALVNLVPAILFAFAADVSWSVAALLAAGSVVGGQIGSRVGRRLPAGVLRAAVLIVGIVAIVRILTG